MQECRYTVHLFGIRRMKRDARFVRFEIGFDDKTEEFIVGFPLCAAPSRFVFRKRRAHRHERGGRRGSRAAARGLLRAPLRAASTAPGNCRETAFLRDHTAAFVPVFRDIERFFFGRVRVDVGKIDHLTFRPRLQFRHRLLPPDPGRRYAPHRLILAACTRYHSESE